MNDRPSPPDRPSDRAETRPPAEPADTAAEPPAPAAQGGEQAARPERRGGGPRRASRAGLGRRQRDAAAEGEAAAERRRARTLREQRRQWSEIRRWVARFDLEPFRQLVERLAQAAFGPAATVMPHLRRSRGRQYLVLVVDAACPEASTNYGAFLPMEQAFWTAYATIPKPAAPFVVAIRPARDWCRSEALMPLFATTRTPDLLA